MAVKLLGNYAKRLGLPGYSSHQFSVSVETELTDMGQVQGEVTRLYGLLQNAVDREIVHLGFDRRLIVRCEASATGVGHQRAVGVRIITQISLVAERQELD